MEQIRFGRWQLACYSQATRAAYAVLAPDTALMEYWDRNFLNFLRARERGLVYPEVIIQLFEQLGIDYRRESVISHLGRFDSGLHIYDGWFHFVGSIVSGRDAQVPVGPKAWNLDPEQITSTFELGFTARIELLEPLEPSFKGHPVVQLIFSALGVPWLIGEPEPT
jgi:hypothetical protein